VSFATKADLKAAIGNWVSRTDLTARMDEFIVLAERDIARNLRKKVIRASLTLDAGSDFKALPAACAILRSVRYDTSSKQYPLTIQASATLAQVRRTGSSAPFYCAIVDNTLLFDVTPDTGYVMEIEYYEKLVPLATDGVTNTVLTDAPDIYLYACLKEVEPYLEHDERNPMWSAKYQKAVEDENQSREEAELGGAPLSPRLPIVFG
jgi:hypothetical protein